MREEMGLTNLKVMVPFCRRPEEERKVLAVIKEEGWSGGDAVLALTTRMADHEAARASPAVQEPALTASV